MPASAQLEVFERLVMPGPLVSDHAEYESDCTQCHARLARDSQRTLCLNCHTEIADDLAQGIGFHALSPDVGTNQCSTCHTDHEGRDADILGLVEETFNHNLTNFPLHDSHLEPMCADCHAPEDTFHAAETECVSCHMEDDQHMGNLGDVCSDCHRETEWSDWFYDHEAENDYVLDGAHATTACVGCHVGEIYMDTPDTCNGCHMEDDEHMGRNGTDCQDCHTTVRWEDTTFDHFQRTEFALVDSHAKLVCDDCHEGNKFEVKTPTECVGCHLEDDSHNGINGPECETCHRETEWLDVMFDHAVDAEFPLNGAHADLKCFDCHVEEVSVANPPDTCFGCHAGEDPHEMQMGEDCARCHAELTWTDDIRFDHDLTTFPLLGNHATIDCDDCHETQAFLDAPEECVDCHVDDDVHESRFGVECAVCHSPVDWLTWRFDHNRQTDFPLDGAHVGLDCHGCHQQQVTSLTAIELSTTCASCHRSDDVHRGEFGDNCEQCHTTTSFEDVTAAQ